MAVCYQLFMEKSSWLDGVEHLPLVWMGQNPELVLAGKPAKGGVGLNLSLTQVLFLFQVF